jgi:hypothetical protein
VAANDGRAARSRRHPPYPSDVRDQPAELAFISRDNDPDRAATFLSVADQLPDVAFADGRLVFVVHDDARLKRSTAGIAGTPRSNHHSQKLFAHNHACPSSRLLCEVYLFPFADAGDLRHLGFQLLASFPKLCDFSQAILDPTSGVILLGLAQRCSSLWRSLISAVHFASSISNRAHPFCWS